MQRRIAEAQLRDGASHDTFGRIDFDIVTDAKRVIEQDRESGDQVAEGVLCCEAKDNCTDAEAGEKRGANRAQCGHYVRIEDERAHDDHDVQELRKK